MLLSDVILTKNSLVYITDPYITLTLFFQIVSFAACNFKNNFYIVFFNW